MYVPGAFREEDLPALHALMQEHAFALLVSGGAEGPFASHLPLWLEPEQGRFGTLYGHMARPNPQWCRFDGRSEALAVFSGPHAYVSPRWYASPRQVPTWNYVAVHAWGVPRVLDDAVEVHGVLRRLTERYEAADGGFRVDELPMSQLDGLARGIVAFALPIARLAGKRKLSQNKSEADRRGVMAGLRAAGDVASAAVAAEMERGSGREAAAPAAPPATPERRSA